MGGLWSAKWWAIYAAQLVGPWNFYYLGSWSTPPMPGQINPGTGVQVPYPLADGSFYYNTTESVLYVWNGTQWTTPYALASGFRASYVYIATAGQTVFTGPDSNGHTPNVGTSPSDIHLNGVKLVPTTDYAIDSSGSSCTLVTGVEAGSILQWDLLVPTTSLAPGAVTTFKVALTPSAPDGTTTVFSMKYTHPTLGPTPVNATDGSQLQVSLDGIVQEPGSDYSATGATLTMATPPGVGAHFWVVWFANAGALP
jgi:hypothetical protein